MIRFIPETRGVECGSREKVVKILMFFAHRIWGRGPEICGGDL